jgi:predicted ArsR family transcriptional regulator
VYGLTREGEELFPKAYAYVLGALVEEVSRKHGRGDAVALLRAVGERAAAQAPRSPALAERVKAAADALRRLGGDVEVQRQGNGWLLRGNGCPLAGVTAAHPEVCGLAQAIVADITGRPVTECCERGERPRCAFKVG